MHSTFEFESTEEDGIADRSFRSLYAINNTSKSVIFSPAYCFRSSKAWENATKHQLCDTYLHYIRIYGYQQCIVISYSGFYCLFWSVSSHGTECCANFDKRLLFYAVLHRKQCKTSSSHILYHSLAIYLLSNNSITIFIVVRYTTEEKKRVQLGLIRESRFIWWRKTVVFAVALYGSHSS
jgi:hypothetical protein